MTFWNPYHNNHCKTLSQQVMIRTTFGRLKKGVTFVFIEVKCKFFKTSERIGNYCENLQIWVKISKKKK